MIHTSAVSSLVLSFVEQGLTEALLIDAQIAGDVVWVISLTVQVCLAFVSFSAHTESRGFIRAVCTV